MFEQRQEQRLRLLLAGPAIVIALVAGLAVLTAQAPGQPVREAVLDLILTLAPRPADDDVPVAAILIDDESEERLGPWPWPRSAYGMLIDAAEAADARSVILTASVAGEDPLSPDVIARRWVRSEDEEPADRLAALAVLPSNDLLLARAAAGGPVGLGLGDDLQPTSAPVRWSRVAASDVAWLALTQGPANVGYVALPTVLGDETLSAQAREARVAVTVGFPPDPDGRVRRVAPVYAARDMVTLSAGLAALAAEGRTVTLTPTPRAISTAGSPPASFMIGNGAPVPLDQRAEFRLWFPRIIDVPTVPAWRVLEDPEAWTTSLSGRHVFIGETISPAGTVRTARGPMSAAELHALTAQQAARAASAERPAWAGFAEAVAAVFLGVLAALAVIFTPTAIAVGSAGVLAILSFAGGLFIFRSTGLLLDPSPGMIAALGAPMAVGATVVVNMVVRDDAVRGAFHGALPQRAMRKLQSHGGGKLLHGLHRDVTVLSCAFKLPPALIKRFEDDPRDFVLFTASTNDRLRKTILEHQGTVDYGEDGRLLGYWNVPLDEEKHIELACGCALKMLDDVSAMSQQVSESHHVAPGGALEELADGRIEIGIATGPCFAGPVGLGGRNRYAALGQPVSFAGRLRARSELYGPAILTDARVYEALRHHYAFLDLDFVRREPGGAPETIYGLVGNPFLKASKTFRDLADVQRDLLEAWRQRDLTAATRHLQKLRGIPGVPQPYVELFEQRIMNARLQRSRREGDQAEVLGP